MTRILRPTSTLPVAAIRIGDRHRRDAGDLRGLAASIDEDGLLHPIVVRPDGELVAGWRRLRAWQLSSRRREPIPVHVVDIAAIARGELAENSLRKDLTPSEMVALMRDLHADLAPIARARQAELGRTHGADDGGAPARFVAQLAPRIGRGIRTRDVVASLVGRSARTLMKAEAIVVAAEREPDRYGRLVHAMDRSGKVDGPFRRLTVMRQAAAIRSAPPALPGNGPYRVIAADVPWPFDPDAEDPSERGTHPYPQMSYAQIAALDVASIAHPDCVLWFWTTNHHLPRAFPIVEAWGFSFRTMLTWTKPVIGRGHYLREQTEHCLLAIRGRPLFDLAAQSTWLPALRGAHSEKPDAFYERVEAVCPAPRYAELFAHHQCRARWDAHSSVAPAIAEATA